MEYLQSTIYFIAVFLAFYYRDKLKGSALKYLPYFLLLDFALDYTSILLRQLHYYNVWLINLIVNFELLFFFVLYFSLLKNIQYKKFAILAGVAYESLFIVNCLISDNWWIDYQEFSFFIGSLLAIIVMMLFILDMLSSDDFLFIHKYTVFWITVAFLFYLIVPFPLSFWLYLFYKYDSEYLVDLYIDVQSVANILMYITLIFGLIWSKKRYK